MPVACKHEPPPISRLGRNAARHLDAAAANGGVMFLFKRQGSITACYCFSDTECEAHMEDKILSTLRDQPMLPRDLISLILLEEEKHLRVTIRGLIEQGKIAPGTDWKLNVLCD